MTRYLFQLIGAHIWLFPLLLVIPFLLVKGAAVITGSLGGLI